MVLLLLSRELCLLLKEMRQREDKSSERGKRNSNKREKKSKTDIESNQRKGQER